MCGLVRGGAASWRLSAAESPWTPRGRAVRSRWRGLEARAPAAHAGTRAASRSDKSQATRQRSGTLGACWPRKSEPSRRARRGQVALRKRRRIWSVLLLRRDRKEHPGRTLRTRSARLSSRHGSVSRQRVERRRVLDPLQRSLLATVKNLSRFDPPLHQVTLVRSCCGVVPRVSEQCSAPHGRHVNRWQGPDSEGVDALFIGCLRAGSSHGQSSSGGPLSSCAFSAG
jgi:hypothetical protein